MNGFETRCRRAILKLSVGMWFRNSTSARGVETQRAISKLSVDARCRNSACGFKTRRQCAVSKLNIGARCRNLACDIETRHQRAVSKLSVGARVFKCNVDARFQNSMSARCQNSALAGSFETQRWSAVSKGVRFQNSASTCVF
ncbi:hypothetical protein QVD17_32045 [Tagetes erecta]|uniref:Uncharacterized protein n=1 Tax=Tagetes erecta TaxID=13708 RepID=A0AAD8NHL7_TARER|nr:hypothetical protein QVD17_32039 [Tagetes erecta]KAK1416251.1 hypothetical protein QVD17_32040 [Tagetes erecta]KAK1416253.1 hypothetical protein QVD17_32042 [Tagetes erecta]KAK1416254.1 hypothetical protein QVD17_32043 [Tagetes erecta]KAK1416255.1 hypothetical protein QVD17_32044 [Tagetes erecta]